MKKRIISLVTLLIIGCLCFTFPCSAAQSLAFSSDNMTLQVPDDFTVIDSSNVAQMAPALQPYGVTVTETEAKLKEGNYLFLGISQSMRCTLFLSKQTDSVSATIGDLISYDQPELARSLLLGKALPQAATVKEIEQNGALFYRVDFGVTDGVGRIAYITVLNGTAYTLCIVDNNGSLNANINAALDFVFESWEYTIDAEAVRIQAFRQRVTTIASWICIPLLCVAGFFLARRLIRDIRVRRLESERRKITPKKPRR